MLDFIWIILTPFGLLGLRQGGSKTMLTLGGVSAGVGSLYAVLFWWRMHIVTWKDVMPGPAPAWFGAGFLMDLSSQLELELMGYLVFQTLLPFCAPLIVYGLSQWARRWWVRGRRYV